MATKKQDARVSWCAARSPEEGWHFGRVGLLRELLETAGTEDAARLRRQLEASWRAYVEVLATSPLERASLLAAGPPRRVGVGNGAAVAEWQGGARSALLAKARRCWQERSAGEPGAGGITAPLRGVHLDWFPPGTRKVPIIDPRFVARAALEESLRVLAHDVRRTAVGAPLVAWRRLRAQAELYFALAHETVQELPRDAYRDWRRSPLPRLEITAMPDAIAQLGGTVWALQALAVEATARCYVAAIDTAEQGPGEEALLCQRLVESMRTSAHRLKQALDGHAQVLLAAAGVAAPPAALMVILRPLPEGMPVLAVLPADAPNVRPLG